MHRKVHLALVLLLFVVLVINSVFYAQGNANVTLLANINPRPSAGFYNDCWGYTAPDGREYALLGVISGTSIIDITDPANAAEVAFIPGANSIWRDIKTYQQYAYVVNETGGGMQIIDLSNLPSSAAVAATYTGFTVMHNIHIDVPNAMLYADHGSASDPCIALSLANPANPVQVSTFGIHNHDSYARNGIVYLSEGDNGTIGIFDLTTPSNPLFLQRITIPAAGYVHNAWGSEDGNYLITTEETVGKTIKFWDISDLDNITLVDQILGPGGLAHNAHIKGNYAYVSHYADGLRIYDISNPANVVEAGFYDTNAATGSGFDGAWGAFPFFDSGKILISDQTNGLFVVSFNPGGGSDADISVSPAALNFSVSENGSDNGTLTIANIAAAGSGDLNWTISEASSAGLASRIRLTDEERRGRKIDPNWRIAVRKVLQNRQTVYFSDDMENGLNGWTTAALDGTTGDLWHQTTANANSANHSWWCSIEGQGNYDTGNRISTALISPVIDLSSAGNFINLEFAENYSTEQSFDFCMVDISTDNGATWTPLRGDTTGTAPSGNSNGWITTALDISAYAGQQINIRFYFETVDEIENNFPGWLIDDVVVSDQSSDVVPWLVENPINGTTTPGSSDAVTVSIDAAGLSAGNYSAVLNINSNDPDSPQISVPVQLAVASANPPDIEISSLQVSLTVQAGDSTSTTFDISNVAGAEADDLNFNIFTSISNKTGFTSVPSGRINYDQPRTAIYQNAQGETVHGIRCGAPSPTQAQKTERQRRAEEWLARFRAESRVTAKTTIPVAFHVVRHDDGVTGDVTDEQIHEQIAVMNTGFANTNFQFNLHSIRRTNNTNWSTGNDEEGMKQQLAVAPAAVLNFYILDLGGGLLGYAYLPGDFPEDHYLHGVVVNYVSLPGGPGGPFNEGDTGTHEVGHYLGLLHTFDGGCVAPGDGIDDTPYQAEPSDGCPQGKDTCPDDPGKDPIHNFMDYSDDACMTEFTPGQSQRMDAEVALHRPTLLQGGSGWLSVSEFSGNIAPQNTRTITITANARELEAGVYNGTLTINSNDPDENPLTISVQLIVSPLVGINTQTSNQVPAQYVLEDNYPNPFNPVTQIRFGLPQAEQVKINIYNMLGQFVTTILNEYKPAGYHTVQFDGRALASGIYLYRIETGQFQAVKKMILSK